MAITFGVARVIVEVLTVIIIVLSIVSPMYRVVAGLILLSNETVFKNDVSRMVMVHPVFSLSVPTKTD